MDPSPAKPDPSTQTSEPRMSSMDKNEIVKEQPKPSMPMTPKNTDGGDRNALKIPVMEDGLRGWSYDIFDCFADPRTCAMSSCCCCYVYSQNKRRWEHLERHGAPLREPVERCNRDCQLFCLFGQAAPALQAINRYDVRRRYAIRGDAFNDVLISVCCHPCGFVQEHREILLEESSFN